VVKAGILTGAFYIQAVVLFLTAFVMCMLPDIGITIFGLVAAGSFFVPGLKYYRQRLGRSSDAAESSESSI
jgi:serine/threonine-protein kinase